MRLDGLWHLFAETGEPMAYLLYRSSGAGLRRNDREKRQREAGKDPRPAD